MTIQLTAAQHAILTYAHQHTEGKIRWFPEHIQGGARKKVLDSLFKRALVTTDGKQWFVTAEGYAALGIPHRSPVTLAALNAAIAFAETNVSRAPRKRKNSKQALVLSMLQRPEGATIVQICEATGWLPHTVRGTFAGAFKKKQGLVITSNKSDGRARTHRISTVEDPS